MRQNRSDLSDLVYKWICRKVLSFEILSTVEWTVFAICFQSHLKTSSLDTNIFSAWWCHGLLTCWPTRTRPWTGYPCDVLMDLTVHLPVTVSPTCCYHVLLQSLSEMFDPRGQTGLKTKILALASKPWPRLGLGFASWKCVQKFCPVIWNNEMIIMRLIKVWLTYLYGNVCCCSNFYVILYSMPWTWPWKIGLDLIALSLASTLKL